MRVGILSGSGTYALPGLEGAQAAAVSPAPTPFGSVEVNEGVLAGVEVAHIARHGAGHARLSNAVNHRANVWALREREVGCVIGLTACGAVDPQLELGSLVLFSDLHFISNRLPDGSLCTFFDRVGDPQRGHWVLNGGPYAPVLLDVLERAASEAGLDMRAGGVYGHVDGPRFNTPAEIAQLAACGVSAVSQTGGPETVLCGELELPYALVGFVTDHANGVGGPEPTPLGTLLELLGRAPETFTSLLRAALPLLAALGQPPRPAGTVVRFGGLDGSAPGAGGAGGEAAGEAAGEAVGGAAGGAVGGAAGEGAS